MKSAILTIGTEILFGQIVNTNAAYLSEQLQLMGFDVMYHYTVGDNPGRLKALLGEIYKECDLVLTTGGLGPTQDDLTKETICEFFNDELVCTDEQLEILKKHFEAYGRPMTENNLKQAYFPSRAVIMKNPAGTAPGFALSDGDKMIACMPGPPNEMTRMFENEIKPYLMKLQDSAIFYRLVKTYGIGESQLETELLPLIDGQKDPTIATYASQGESYLRIASKRRTEEEARAAVDDMLEKVKGIIGKYIYSCDGESLPEVVCRKLMERNITISCAESCTGGMFAGRLTDIPGVSSVFNRGYVTYSNEAKVQELGVSEKTLEEFGAVSEQTALEMARGVRNQTGSDLCISVTGIAGPDGGSEEKPVGLVYIGAVYNGKEVVKKHQIRSHRGRGYIRGCAVLEMFNVINELVE